MSELGATFSFVSNIISGGVLGFPFCFSRCGLVLGTLLLVCTALSQTFTLKQLVYASTVTRTNSFEEVRLVAKPRARASSAPPDLDHAFAPEIAFLPRPQRTVARFPPILCSLWRSPPAAPAAFSACSA